MGKRSTKIELKFVGAPGDLAAFVDSVFLKAIITAPGAWRRIATVWFDTEKGDLVRRGVTLSRREEAGRIIQSIDTVGASHSPMKSRAIESRIRQGSKFPRKPGVKTIDRLIKRYRSQLRPIFVMHVDRWHAETRLDAATIALAIDLGRAERPETAKETSIAELKLELIDGLPLALFEIAKLITANVPVRLSLESGLESGLEGALAGAGPKKPQRKGPKKTSPAPLPPDAMVADGIGAAAAAAVSVIAVAQNRALDYRAPEGIRRIRVAIRRLRAAELFFRPALQDGALRDLAIRGRGFARALGPARDIDVFLDTTMPSVSPMTDRGNVRFKARADQFRAEAWRDVHRTLSSAAFQQWLIDLVGFASVGDGAANYQTDLRKALRGNLRDYADKAFERRRKKLVALAKTHGFDDAASRHRFRLSLKKLRYPAVLLADAYPKRPRRDYLKAVTDLQNVLGRANDAAAAQAMADYIAKGEGAPAMHAAGFISGYKAAEAAAAAVEIEDAWRRLRLLKPFWRD